MYTMELEDAETQVMWQVIDPYGDFVINGLTQDEAEGLLTHLNRG